MCVGFCLQGMPGEPGMPGKDLPAVAGPPGDQGSDGPPVSILSGTKAGTER